MNSAAGIGAQRIPYRGGDPAIADLMGGQVRFIMAPPIDLVGHVNTNRLRAIAIAGAPRIAALPDVPAFAHAGLPGVSLKS